MERDRNTKMKIMLVDDTPANIDILRETLKSEHYDIAVAPNGETALKIAPRFEPDLILLDVMMPGIDGYETCKKLKENEKTKEIAVIFITAKTEVEDIVKGFTVGGVDYITKPFRQEEVCARVQTQLQLRFSENERLRLISDLEDRNIKLSGLNELKNKFMGMAAHDLRTPLASVRGFSELLLHDGDNFSEEERKELLTTMHEVSQQMLDMVNDLLDYSVIDSGKLDLQIEPACLSALIEKRIHLIRVVADKKSIVIHKSLPELQELMIDSNRIAQVVDNLISNAIKFSPANSNIYISLESKDQSVSVTVRDEGPGITEEDQKKLFKGFQKLTNKPTGGEKSTGLGLAIVKRMVEAHNGKLIVESTPGSGSTFTFVLPTEMNNDAN